MSNHLEGLEGMYIGVLSRDFNARDLCSNQPRRETCVWIGTRHTHRPHFARSRNACGYIMLQLYSITNGLTFALQEIIESLVFFTYEPNVMAVDEYLFELHVQDTQPLRRDQSIL